MSFTTTTPSTGPNASPFNAGGNVFSNPGVSFDRSGLTSSAQVSSRKAAPKPMDPITGMGGGNAGIVPPPPLISPPPPVAPPIPPAMMGLQGALGGANAGGDAINFELGAIRQDLGPRNRAPLASVAALQQLKAY